VVVTGGFQPGQSTATVAALVAEAVGSPVLLNAANIDAVYSDDPKKNPNAKRLPELTYDEFEKILRSSSLPGGYELMDLWSLSILRRSCITTYVFDGRRPELLEAIAKGENPGSKITC
jgi:uridylate kinase